MNPSKLKTKSILIFLTLYYTTIHCETSPPCTNSKYASQRQVPSLNIQLLVFSNFAQFTDIYTNCLAQNQTKLNHIQFFPKKKLIINDEFSLEKILKPSQINQIADMSVANIKGIDLNKTSLSLNKHFLFAFYYSSLDFYYSNQTQVSLDFECDLSHTIVSI